MIVEATEAMMTKIFLVLAIVGLHIMPAWAEGPATPDACKLVSGADVTAALGAGFQLVDNPLAAKLAKNSEYSGCLYRKEGSGTVAIAILRTSSGAKAAVIGRQESQRRAGRSVTPVPGLCEAAFVLVISPKKTNVVAAKGTWQVETEVTMAGKPDAPAAQKLAKVVCSRLP